MQSNPQNGEGVAGAGGKSECIQLKLKGARGAKKGRRLRRDTRKDDVDALPRGNVAAVVWQSQLNLVFTYHILAAARPSTSSSYSFASACPYHAPEHLHMYNKDIYIHRIAQSILVISAVRQRQFLGFSHFGHSPCQIPDSLSSRLVGNYFWHLSGACKTLADHKSVAGRDLRMRNPGKCTR